MDLLILGASARSAAFSAIRVGLSPTCADLFADADLAAACPVHRVEGKDYPEGLLTFARSIEPTPWLYTGALENRPDLVDAISERHPLMGNPGTVLRAVRDPLALAQAVREAGFSAPEVRLDPSEIPMDGTWLRKPLASAGGQGIHRWVQGIPETRRPTYFQQRIVGLPLASTHVAKNSGAQLVGISRQYVGRGGSRFSYRGSLAPWPVAESVSHQVEQLGQAIARAFGLVGLFGIDLIFSDGQAWPVEVNPRYTASVEVMEWALGRSILADHLQACGTRVKSRDKPPALPHFVAKRILFATRSGQWRGISPLATPQRFPEVADTPPEGSSFEAGEPLFTVFGHGESVAACQRSLAVTARKYRP